MRVQGFGTAFDGAVFREAIRNTMKMGLPEDEAERVTFRWTPDRTYANGDSAGNPWSWDDTPATEDAPADVQVAAAVEFSARPAGSVDTVMGQFDTSRVAVTLLDEDFELIRGADLMIFDGAIYEVQFIAPPVGLFDVTVYTIYGEARDES